jgi:hypothetical protein
MTSVSSAACVRPPFQHQLFGVAFEADDQMMIREPCPQCASTVTVVGSGSGPHWGVLRCIRGHYLKWIPRPVQ